MQLLEQVELLVVQGTWLVAEDRAEEQPCRLGGMCPRPNHLPHHLDYTFARIRFDQAGGRVVSHKEQGLSIVYGV